MKSRRYMFRESFTLLRSYGLQSPLASPASNMAQVTGVGTDYEISLSVGCAQGLYDVYRPLPAPFGAPGPFQPLRQEDWDPYQRQIGSGCSVHLKRNLLKRVGNDITDPKYVRSHSQQKSFCHFCPAFFAFSTKISF